MSLIKREWITDDERYVQFTDTLGFAQGETVSYYLTTGTIARIHTRVDGVLDGIFKVRDKHGRLIRAGFYKQASIVGEYLVLDYDWQGNEIVRVHRFIYTENNAKKRCEIDTRHISKEEKLIINLKCGTGPWLLDDIK